MADDRGLTTVALTGALLAEYRADLLNRLAVSYETYRGVECEAARALAERRVEQFFSALETDPSDTRTLGFRDDGRPVGVVSFTMNRRESHLFLWDILIHGPYRRKGFGTRALAAVERIAAEAGLERVQLSIEYGNESSTRFFARMGYRFVAVSALKLLA